MRVVPLDSLEKDINRYRFFIFKFHSWIFKRTSKFWATSCKNVSNLMLVWITVCIGSCLVTGWRTYIGLKNPPKSCSILVWIAGCWNSLLMSLNPKNNWCLSRIFGAWFGGKGRGLSTCKTLSKQVGGWIYFCTKWTLNSYQIFKVKI